MVSAKQPSTGQQNGKSWKSMCLLCSCKVGNPSVKKSHHGLWHLKVACVPCRLVGCCSAGLPTKELPVVGRRASITSRTLTIEVVKSKSPLSTRMSSGRSRMVLMVLFKSARQTFALSSDVARYETINVLAKLTSLSRSSWRDCGTL